MSIRGPLLVRVRLPPCRKGGSAGGRQGTESDLLRPGAGEAVGSRRFIPQLPRVLQQVDLQRQSPGDQRRLRVVHAAWVDQRGGGDV